MKHKAIMQTLGSQISDSDDVVCPQAKGDFELGMNYAMNFGILILPYMIKSTIAAAKKMTYFSATIVYPLTCIRSRPVDEMIFPVDKKCDTFFPIPPEDSMP